MLLFSIPGLRTQSFHKDYDMVLENSLDDKSGGKRLKRAPGVRDKASPAFKMPVSLSPDCFIQ